LLDIRLPDVDGMELQERLRTSASLLPVIFLTGFGDIATSVKAMKSGAMDFLPKPVNDETLLRAVDVALAEGARVRAADVENEQISRGHESLTPRERDVFLLVLAGRLNKQIARELGISEKTVKVHRGRVMAKMGARRVAQLVQFAARIGLVPGAGVSEVRAGQAAGRTATRDGTDARQATTVEPVRSSALAAPFR
jgi:FixJ family two-component response regulator